MKKINQEELVLQNVLDFSNIGLLRILPDKSIIYLNNAVLCLLSIENIYKKPDGLTDKDFSKLFISQIPFESIINSILVNGSLKSYEYKIKTLNGIEKCLLIDGYSIKEDGEKKIIQLLIRDISANKNFENAFVDSEKRYKLLAENTQDAIWTMTNDYKFTYISPSIQKLTGYSVNECKSKKLSEILIPESYKYLVKRLSEKFENVLKGSENADKFETLEFQIINKNDETLWLESQLAYVLDNNKKPTGLIGATRNINNKKRLELQLQQSQKLEAVGRLAGGIAHDFNNILSIISCYNQLAIEAVGDSNETVSKNLNEIMNAAGRGASLSRQLLSFGKRQFVKPAIIDLNKLIEDIARMLKRIIGEEIDFVTLLGDEISTILADISQIEQVLLNLIINARDALINKGGYILVKTENFLLHKEDAQLPNVKPGKYVHLYVADTGCGMDAGTLNHAFEPFFTTKAEGGTGLGLATVYGIVKQSEGYIFINSVTDSWTKIDIFFPVYENKREKAAIPENFEVSDYSGTGTILVVDDDLTICDLLTVILETSGYCVLKTSNVKDAIGYARTYEGKIDLLLSDMIMPCMNGKQLSERIKELRPKIKTVFVTGYADDILKKQISGAKNLFYISKPFTPNSVLRVIKKILK